MGLYAVKCPQCGTPFMWWSGCLDQRCQACKDKDVEALQEKNESLERHIDRLSAALAQLESKVSFHSFSRQPVEYLVNIIKIGAYRLKFDGERLSAEPVFAGFEPDAEVKQ
jgi:hypothetical protein